MYRHSKTPKTAAMRVRRKVVFDEKTVVADKRYPLRELILRISSGELIEYVKINLRARYRYSFAPELRPLFHAIGMNTHIAKVKIYVDACHPLDGIEELAASSSITNLSIRTTGEFSAAILSIREIKHLRKLKMWTSYSSVFLDILVRVMAGRLTALSLEMISASVIEYLSMMCTDLKKLVVYGGTNSETGYERYIDKIVADNDIEFLYVGPCCSWMYSDATQKKLALTAIKGTDLGANLLRIPTSITDTRVMNHDV